MEDTTKPMSKVIRIDESETRSHPDERVRGTVEETLNAMLDAEADKNKEGHSIQDPEVSWNVKAGSDGKRKSTCGYKAHMNVDEDGLIQSTDDSPGHVHDSNCFTDLLSDDESAVYADSAYRSQVHDQWLAERQIDHRIIKRGYRNKPLDERGGQYIPIEK